MILVVSGLVIAVILAAVFAGMESGIYAVERVRLQLRAAEGSASARNLLQIVDDPARALCTLLLANTLAHYAVAAWSTLLLEAANDGPVDAVTLEIQSAIFVAPALFVFAELLPKSIFLRHPGALLGIFWPVYRATAILLAVVVVPLLSAIRRARPSQGGEAGWLLRRDAVAGLLTRDDEADRLTKTQRSLAGAVLDLRAHRIADAMVPIDRVASVTESASSKEILEMSARSGRSRILVCSEDRTEVFGYLNVLDAAFEGDRPEPLRERLHTLPRISGDRPLLDALGVLQRARRPLALVTLGGTDRGIISSGDIVQRLLRGPKSLESAPGGRKPA